MELMRLMKVASSLGGLTLSSDPSEFKGIFDLLGLDEAMGGQFLQLARLQADDQQQLFMSFLESGGLWKILASPSARIEHNPVLDQCPHCSEMIAR